MNQRRAWLWSAAISIGLLAIIVTLADARTVLAQIAGLPWPLVMTGMLLLQFEGVCTALRTRLLARTTPALRDCMTVTAWWVAGLAVLPARLGELSGLHMMTSRLRQSAGEALNNLFLQRLFDGVVLLGLGALAIAAQAHLLLHRNAILMSLAAATTAAVILIRQLPALFGLVATLLRRFRHSRRMRFLLRAALNGRRAAHRALSGGLPWRLAVLSLLKCLCNISGIALVINSVLPAVNLVAAATSAVLFNLTAVIPLQTVGGVGIGEVTLAGSFAWFGASAVAAASAALLLRVFLIAAPLVFWLAVIAFDTLLPARRRTVGVDR